MKERLQKIMAARGLCSRRAAEKIIEQGRVKLNGITACVGDTADPSVDCIEVDGRPLAASAETVVIMLNKPRGYVTTMSDEAGRPQVTDLVRDIPVRLHPIGRLDMHSEGLLLMTNDGALTNALTHPSHAVYKKYLLKLSGDASDKPAHITLSRVTELDGRPIAPAKCQFVANTEKGCIITISIREGRNRQIRRMCAQCGFTVLSLKRVAVGRLSLGDLPTGAWRHVSADELAYLKSL